MRSLFAVSVLILGMIAAPSMLIGQSLGPRELAASAAAEAWLAHIDSGSYEESWAQASAVFKSAVAADRWEATVRQVAGQTGALVRRELSAVTPATNPPGAPAGEYMTVTFNSSFAAVPAAAETVVLRREGDAWKMAGYFVRPA